MELREELLVFMKNKKEGVWSAAGRCEVVG